MTPSPPENYFQFEKLLVELVRAGVDFAVVGGVAVSLNGFVRATDGSWRSEDCLSRCCRSDLPEGRLLAGKGPTRRGRVEQDFAGRVVGARRIVTSLLEKMRAVSVITPL